MGDIRELLKVVAVTVAITIVVGLTFAILLCGCGPYREPTPPPGYWGYAQEQEWEQDMQAIDDEMHLLFLEQRVQELEGQVGDGEGDDGY